MTLVWVQTILQILIVYEMRAYKSKQESRMSIFGDLFVLLVSYFFLVFNMVEAEENFIAGYAPISITGIYIFVSLVTMSITTFKVTKIRLRTNCARKTYLK